MPYDELLARRVKPLVARQVGFEEKKMFGGIGYLLHGNMCCGVWREFFIARVGLERYEEALAAAHTKVFDITGRVMRGWVMVEPDGLIEPAELKHWVDLSIEFAETLPRKA